MYTGIMTSTCLPFTGKCRYFENLNSRCFDLRFIAVLICRYFENTENVAILIISRMTISFIQESTVFDEMTIHI